MAIITAMGQEMRPLLRPLSLSPLQLGDLTAYRGTSMGHSIVAAVSGMGMVPARLATERVLDSFDADRVLMVGIAGGVHPGLGIGSPVSPSTVIDAEGVEYHPIPAGSDAPSGVLLSTDEFIADAGAVVALRRRGVVAVDMETASVGSVCAERGVDWSVFRAISDRAGDSRTDAEVLTLVDSDGSANPAATLRYLGRHPGRIGHLVRLGRGSAAAIRTASSAALVWLADPVE